MNESLKERLKSLSDALIAFSLVNLCFIRTRFALFFTDSFDYYKKNNLFREGTLALLLNLLLFGILGWRALRWIRRANSPNLFRAACIVTLVLMIIPVDFLRTFYFHVRGIDAVSWIKNPFLLGAGFLVVFVVLFVIWRWPRSSAHVFGVALLICTPSALLTFGKIGYFYLNYPTGVPFQPQPFYPTPVAGVQPRVIWIIYDELDQRLAFSSRPADCPLPELDRIRNENFQATNALSAGNATLISMPALISGRYVVTAKPASGRELNVTYAHASEPMGWSTQPSVFSDARELGYNTAVVGWYHPYTRLFASNLNFSAWYPYPPYQPARDETVLHSMTSQIWSLASAVQQRRMQIALYQESLDNARALVKDGRYGMVLLHLPGPHYPGIYDPAKGTFTLTSFSHVGAYFQNLQLTDKTMGILRRDMEQSGQWDRSWVIISADHWWRESREYDGVLDRRVPFILKAPGNNNQPMVYGEPMNTVVTRDLIHAILRKEISTIPEVAAWLDAHKAPPAPPYSRM